jgi:nicotinate-nucleotide adenylyltransferase
MKIGVLGGTFDPPHAGHLALARAALECLGLDEVIFMPTSRNPLKATRASTSAQHRAGMVEALIRSSDESRLSYSDQEITRGGPSYTVETMSELQMAQPADYWFLLGADAIRSLPEWKQPQRLIRLCRLGVVIRPPLTEASVLARLPQEYRERVDIVPMEPLEVSSTELREKLSRHQNVSTWIPQEVLKYIYTHRLYQK